MNPKETAIKAKLESYAILCREVEVYLNRLQKVKNLIVEVESRGETVASTQDIRKAIDWVAGLDYGRPRGVK